MQRLSSNGLEWLSFDLLSNFPHLVQGVFTRKGGYSSHPHFGLNLDLDTLTDTDTVTKNLMKVKDTLRINDVKFAEQTHGDLVVSIDHASPYMTEKADGIMTKEPNLALFSLHADCQSAIFYDPCHNAIATIHSGWRGSVKNIFGRGVIAMQQHYGSRPQDLLVGISPSLGPNMAEFINYKNELPEAFWSYQTKPNHFDFWAISEMQLKQAGILPQHIEIARICTFDNPDDFYSFRRSKKEGMDGPVKANNATFAMLLP